MADLKRKSSKKESCLNAGDCIANETESILINNLRNVEKKNWKKKAIFLIRERRFNEISLTQKWRIMDNLWKEREQETCECRQGERRKSVRMKDNGEFLNARKMADWTASIESGGMLSFWIYEGICSNLISRLSWRWDNAAAVLMISKSW